MIIISALICLLASLDKDEEYPSGEGFIQSPSNIPCSLLRLVDDFAYAHDVEVDMTTQSPSNMEHFYTDIRTFTIADHYLSLVNSLHNITRHLINASLVELCLLVPLAPLKGYIHWGRVSFKF